MKVNPQPVINRHELNLRLGIKCSLPDIDKLFAIVYSIYAAIKKSEILFSDESVNSSGKTIIKLKAEYETIICDFFDSQINTFGTDRLKFIAFFNNTPLFNQHIESLQVALQLYWKLGEINFEDSLKTNTVERTGGNRYSKKINFSTNIDLIELTFSDDENIISEEFKNLLFEVITNTTISNETIKTKLAKLLTNFTEEATYKIRTNGDEIIFQQIGIYEEIIAGNTIESNDITESVGPLRILKSSLSDNLNYFIEDNRTEGFKLNVNTNIDELKEYSKRVNTRLNLSPKSTNIEIENDKKQLNSGTPSAKNIIFYGAPGTGKSHKIDTKIEDLDNHFFERVTFHPEFDNISFVGGYKPRSVKVRREDEDGEYFDNEVHYEFVPQSFTSIYERAWKDLDHQYYLVIEEINRGNCAEIFGEIFQLLDRTSKYTVSPSKELREYLENAFKDVEHLGIVNGLKLPKNLNILATMNTSDQSLFPMDSAFKRRWDWEYIPICYLPTDELGNKNDSFDFKIDIEDGEKYKWTKFIEKINLNHIKNNPSLGMDKCIGNYFIKPDNDKTISLKPFINKVIFYLWNDVFKDEDNKVFEENTSYEDFFPIKKNGQEKIKELFDRIGLHPLDPSEIIEDDSKLEEISQGSEEIGS